MAKIIIGVAKGWYIRVAKIIIGMVKIIIGVAKCGILGWLK